MVEKLKKNWKVISIALAVVVIASIVLTILLFPKDNNKFDIEAKEISIQVGETADIEYKVTKDGVSITIKVEDGEIAKIVSQEGEKKLEGVRVGETTLTIYGRKNDYYLQKTVKVIVTEVPIKNETPIEDEKTPEEDLMEETIKINFENCMNCTVNEETITATGSYCIFSITSTENIESIEITSTFTELEIKKVTGVGNNTYKVVSSEEGSFELEIKINNKTAKYTIIF